MVSLPAPWEGSSTIAPKAKEHTPFLPRHPAESESNRSFRKGRDELFPEAADVESLGQRRLPGTKHPRREYVASPPLFK